MAETQGQVLKTLRSRTLNQINQGNKRTHTFNVDFADVNPKFIGTFTVHYPTQMEKLHMGVLRSTLLNGNLNVDVMTYNIAYVLSTLDTVLDAKPDWFDIDDPDIEYDLLNRVFTEYEEWVNSFRKPSEPDKDTGDSKNAGSEIPVVDTKNISGATNG